MTVLAEDARTKLWFGTVERSGWFPTPNRGASVGSEGWNAGGVLLSGGGYQIGSFGTHRVFTFEWPSSSSRIVAQRMKSYYDGSFGRGLIYFLDPLTYTTNILPAFWADPSMTVASETPTLVPSVEPTSTPTSGGDNLFTPINSAVYDLSGVGVTTPSILDDSNSVYVPIPDGYDLHLGAIYSATANAGVYYSMVSSSGGISGTSRLDPLSTATTVLHNTVIPKILGQAGIRLWVGKTSASVATVTLTAMSARLSKTGTAAPGESFWVGGQGHSGCRFSAPPTYINNTGTNGGQVSFAASFREVGSWVRGQ